MRSASSVSISLCRDGGQVTRTVATYRKQCGDESKNLVVFRAPADIAGTAVLTSSHPDRGRRHVDLPPGARPGAAGECQHARSETFMGTDFTYEDLGAVADRRPPAPSRPRWGRSTGEEVYKVNSTPTRRRWVRQSGHLGEPQHLLARRRSTTSTSSAHCSRSGASADVREVKGIPTPFAIDDRERADRAPHAADPARSRLPSRARLRALHRAASHPCAVRLATVAATPATQRARRAWRSAAVVAVFASRSARRATDGERRDAAAGTEAGTADAQWIPRRVERLPPPLRTRRASDPRARSISASRPTTAAACTSPSRPGSGFDGKIGNPDRGNPSLDLAEVLPGQGSLPRTSTKRIVDASLPALRASGWESRRSPGAARRAAADRQPESRGPHASSSSARSWSERSASRERASSGYCGRVDRPTRCGIRSTPRCACRNRPGPLVSSAPRIPRPRDHAARYGAGPRPAIPTSRPRRTRWRARTRRSAWVRPVGNAEITASVFHGWDKTATFAAGGTATRRADG